MRAYRAYRPELNAWCALQLEVADLRGGCVLETHGSATRPPPCSNRSREATGLGVVLL
jgi:hypothetical protein